MYLQAMSCIWILAEYLELDRDRILISINFQRSQPEYCDSFYLKILKLTIITVLSFSFSFN